MPGIIQRPDLVEISLVLPIQGAQSSAEKAECGPFCPMVSHSTDVSTPHTAPLAKLFQIIIELRNKHGCFNTQMVLTETWSL